MEALGHFWKKLTEDSRDFMTTRQKRERRQTELAMANLLKDIEVRISPGSISDKTSSLLSDPRCMSSWRQYIREHNNAEATIEKKDANIAPTSVPVFLIETQHPTTNFDKWTMTPPSRRIELLEPEEQISANELSRAPQLTTKENRTLTNKLFKLSRPRRALVFECSRYADG